MKHHGVRHRTRLSDRLLESLTVWHAGAFVIAATWGFGGNIYWMRTPLALWGTYGILLTIAGLCYRLRRHPEQRTPLRSLAPLALFIGLVLLSATNPNHATAHFFGNLVLRPIPPERPWLPSSARPDLALHGLWLFGGFYLAGYNILLNVRRRRALRRLLFALVTSAMLLAVFGTAQKLVAAEGLFFGFRASPNPTFFASFIYHNHWSAFALLMVAAALGLLDHYVRRGGHDGFWRSPAATMLAASLLLAATIPLSSSRSGTLLLVMFGTIALGHVARRVWQARRAEGRAVAAPLATLGAGAALGIFAITWLAAPVLSSRVDKTREQLAERAEIGGLGGREIVYRNTWRMARDHPWTGWGLESYATVFVRYNTEGSAQDHLTVEYDQAHSDWLQSLAETGVIGTGLLLLMAVVPMALRRRHWHSDDVMSQCLLLACAMIATYAWVEFPFANPAVALTFWIVFFSGVRSATIADRA